MREDHATRRLTIALAAAALLALPGCADVGTGVLAPAGPIAAANRTVLLNSLAVMLAIVVPTLLAIVGFAWWFRDGNARAHYDPEFTYSGRIELLVWSVPILTILFLGGLIWVGSHEIDPKRPIASTQPPLEVQVVSMDWKWLFIYPAEGVASVNRLYLPAGRPVHFRLTSSSVMNTFFVPRLGSMIYTMNGMSSELNLMADRPGHYFGQSAHYSGDGFSDMNFTAIALPPAGFGAWVAGAKAAGPILDARAYRLFSRQSNDQKPFTFRAVQPGLYDAVVSQQLPPAPGPETGRGGHPEISPGKRDS